jgi:hypothetical protein
MLPDIHRRIVNAKYVLEKAASIQAESSEMSFSISLLLMHDAIELMMLAVLDHLKVNVKNKREFLDFWSDIKQAGQPEPPDRIPMEALNKLRVGLKHNGNLPNPQNVRDLLPRTRGFFENVLGSYCQMTYEDVSLIDLISDEEVRTILKAARQKFTDGDKPAAMADLKIAFHKLDNPEGKYLPKLHAPGKPSLPSELTRVGWGNYLDQRHSFLEQCASRTNAIMFGIDPIRYARFTASGPGVQWSMTGIPYVNHWSTYQEVSLKNFDEFVSLLIDYALKVSEAYIPLTIRN